VIDGAGTPVSSAEARIDAWVSRTARRLAGASEAAAACVRLDGFGAPGEECGPPIVATDDIPSANSPLLERITSTWARLDANAALARCFLRQDRRGAITVAAAQAPGPTAGVQAVPALAGMLVAHKDLFAQDGVVATFAAHPALHRRGTRDAMALARLRAAGAVDLGSLHMSEFAMGPTGFSETLGFIDNPAFPEQVSGGSSSGSAAVVASGLVDGALGTDTGGSIRIPAAFCGVVGMKPSRGLVPVQGVMPLSVTLDCVGPLGPDVPTVAKLLDALTGHAHGNGPHAVAAMTPPERPPTIGVLAPSSLPVAPEREVADALDNAIYRLAASGCTIRTLHFPDISTLNALSATVFLCEGAAVHLRELMANPEWFGPQVRYRLLQGLALSGSAYVVASSTCTTWRQRWLDVVSSQCDALLLPVTPVPAPTRREVEDAGDVTQTLERNAVLGSYTAAFNYLGLPVLALPLGATLGLQVVGRAAGDAYVLHVGAWMARTLAT